MPGGHCRIGNFDNTGGGPTQLHPFGGAGSSCLRPSPPPCLGKITGPQNIDHKYSKKLSKIDHKSTKHLPKMHPKSIKNRPKICAQGPLGGVLEALGGLLGGSWGSLGAILAPRANKSPKGWFVGPPWTPQLGAKIQQKST